MGFELHAFLKTARAIDPRRLNGSIRENPNDQNRPQSPLHIPWMAKKSHSRLLEVAVTPLDPTRWEWRVYEGDTPLMTGFETSFETAQIEADGALFRLLSVDLGKLHPEGPKP
jgi:hypothetical protein